MRHDTNGQFMRRNDGTALKRTFMNTLVENLQSAVGVLVDVVAATEVQKLGEVGTKER